MIWWRRANGYLEAVLKKIEKAEQKLKAELKNRSIQIREAARRTKRTNKCTIEIVK
jgi:hypothetical protein